jgi:hypothetical protein
VVCKMLSHFDWCKVVCKTWSHFVRRALPPLSAPVVSAVPACSRCLLRGLQQQPQHPRREGAAAGPAGAGCHISTAQHTKECACQLQATAGVAVAGGSAQNQPVPCGGLVPVCQHAMCRVRVCGCVLCVYVSHKSQAVFCALYTICRLPMTPSHHRKRSPSKLWRQIQTACWC